MLMLILQAHLVFNMSGSFGTWEYASQKSFSLTWALCSFWYSLTFTSSCAWSRFHFCDILVICYCNSKVLIYIPDAFWRHPFLGTVGCSQPSFQLPLGGNTTNIHVLTDCFSASGHSWSHPDSKWDACQNSNPQYAHHWIFSPIEIDTPSDYTGNPCSYIWS